MATPATIDFDALLKPVSEANPVGDNLTYDKVYDQIKEARRCDDPTLLDKADIWKPKVFKDSDWKAVTKLTTEALTKRSKDLQLAAWLTEALTRRLGFAGLRDGLKLCSQLLATFPEGVYPQPEDGDMELRATPLAWLIKNILLPIKQIPLTATGNPVEYDFLRWEESQEIDNIARKDQSKADALIDEGKITGETFNKALDATADDHFRQLIADARQARDELSEFERIVDDNLGNDGPALGPIKDLFEKLDRLFVRIESQRGLTQQVASDNATDDRPSDEASDSADVAGSDPSSDSSSRDDDRSWASSTDAAGYDAVSRSAAPKPPTRPAPRGNLSAEPQSPQDAMDRIITAANWLRRDKSSSPVPYLVLRALRWGELRANPLPPETERLAAPPSETRQRLRTLRSNTDWSTLLEEAEAAAAQPEGRAWLDAHRYSLEALRDQGYDYEPAYNSLAAALKALLAAVPELPDSELADGTPTANAETRRWLRENGFLDAVQSSSGAASPPPEPPPQYIPADYSNTTQDAHSNGSHDSDTTDSPAPEPDIWQRAVEAVRAGRVSEGFNLIRERMAAAQSGRERYMLKLQLSELCMLADRPKVALPVLEEMAVQIDEYHLEQWEARDLTVRVYNTLCHCYRKLNGSVPGGEEKFRKAYDRLCRLDLAQAMAWGEL